MKNKPLKLRHFISIGTTVSYISAELLASLQIDLARAESVERHNYSDAQRKEMRARIADIVAVEPGIHYLSDRERATVLAALRLRQRCDLHDYDLMDVVTNSGTVEPLTDVEVDQLCVRLNLGR